MKVCGAVALILGALIAGCGSSDGGEGGNSPTGAGGGGAGGAGGGSGDCAPQAATEVTDVSGTWALLQVGSLNVLPQGFTTPITNRIVDLLLVKSDQTGEQVTLSGEYCDHYTEEEDAFVKASIPVAYRDSLVDVERVGTFAAGQLRVPELVEVVGASLSSPTEALPTEPDDARLFDQDGDQKPGVTIALSGLVDGEVYVAERKKTTLDGVAVSADRIEGLTSFSSEQSVVDADPANLKDQVASSEQSTDPNACNSYFVMLRVDDAMTCETLRTQRETLFGQ
ncbi:hypothetical protein [Chondromyces apiculatus]|uniref:Lipoprotein n=1 Tax=Chondromyces apiculatus DSM 436 TaxID=1192034 RepID=A0A017SVU9_9BACT|nr:hypothetical protein [Chondromyces apiculatus]EYF00902.1 Hypothetical protein CAP_8919 [Chondromyces apiculatus DSM 436]